MTRPRRALGGARPTPTQLITSARVGFVRYVTGVNTSLRGTAAALADRVHRAEPRKELVRTGIAALTITALGLGAAGAMAATSAATNVADPAAVSSTSWPAFETRAQGTSRDSTRPDIETAEQQRAKELSAASDKVSQAGQEAALDERAKQLAGASTDTTKAARELESAAKVAEQNRAKKVMPLDSYRIAAQFGAVGAWARYHTGVDFSAPLGTPIHAVAAGVVTHVGTGGGAGGWAGSYVVVQHEDGYSTLYAHMNPAIAVSVGQKVGPHELLGHVGLTGRTFGPHCHVELYPPGTTPGDVYSAVNLLPWISAA